MDTDVFLNNTKKIYKRKVKKQIKKTLQSI